MGRDPRAYVETLVAHRRDREDQILRCLARGIDRIPDMVAAMYADVDRRLHPAAAMSVFSHIVAMTEDRRILTDGPPSPAGSFRLPAR